MSDNDEKAWTSTDQLKRNEEISFSYADDCGEKVNGVILFDNLLQIASNMPSFYDTSNPYEPNPI